MAKNEAPTTVTEQVGADFDKRNLSSLYNPIPPATTPFGRDIEKGRKVAKKVAVGIGDVLAGAGAVAGTLKEAIKQKDIANVNEAGAYFGGTPEELAVAQKRTAATGIYPSDIGRAFRTGEVVSPLPTTYTPKATSLPTFTPEQVATADAMYNKAFPVVKPEEKAAAEKNLASGLPSTQPSALDNALETASTQAAGVREGQRQKEFAEYQKNNPPQSYGMGGGGTYENIDMKKGNITLYGEKPQPYKDLSPASQQLIKEMEDQGVPAWKRAENIRGLIASEMGEKGAIERAKLGMEKEVANRNLTLEQDMKKHNDLLLRHGRQEEAAAESENFKQVKDTYTRKDDAGNEYLDLSGIAEQYKSDWSKLNPTMREAVFSHIKRFDDVYARTIADPELAKNFRKKDGSLMSRDEMWKIWSQKNRS